MELAITGVGVVSGLGVGRDAFFEALSDPGAARAKAFRGASDLLEAFPDANTAEVWDWDPKRWLGDKGHRNNDQLTKYLITAAKLALIDAGVKDDEGIFVRYEGARVGIASATAYGSLDAIGELNRVAELEDPRYINPQRFPNTVINAAAGYVSIWEGLMAPNTTIVDGNCGSLDAVLSAYTHLAFGRADAMLVGGGEIVCESLYVALAKLGVLADMRNDDLGISVGEGAAFLVVEDAERAWERSANVLGVIRGYGTAFDAPQSEAVLVHAGSDAVQAAIQDALSEAEIGADEVDVVASARCGLPSIDDAELHGIRAVFGHDVCVVAPKQLTGENFGVAGAFGMIMALAWMHGAKAEPRVAGPKPGEVATAVVVSVGYYGNVSAVVVTKE
jgi:3-oxoacyl-(acyl-carrier-protein) synthase